MMLRGSSAASGTQVNLEAIVAGQSVDSLLPGGAALVRFTDAILRHEDDRAAARQALIAELGDSAMVDAAGVVGNFQRMVRIADSTGIPVDGRMAAANEEVREQLGLNDLPSARLII